MVTGSAHFSSMRGMQVCENVLVDGILYRMPVMKLSGDSIVQLPPVQRPSQSPGRTHVNKIVAAQSSSQTIHTVTAGKILYVMGISVNAINTNISANGDLRIRDGVSGTEKVPFLIPTAGLGTLLAAQPLQTSAMNFQEPLQFSTSVRAEVITGTLVFSISISGYEE